MVARKKLSPTTNRLIAMIVIGFLIPVFAMWAIGQYKFGERSPWPLFAFIAPSLEAIIVLVLAGKYNRLAIAAWLIVVLETFVAWLIYLLLIILWDSESRSDNIHELPTDLSRTLMFDFFWLVAAVPGLVIGTANFFYRRKRLLALENQNQVVNETSSELTPFD